MSSKIVEEEDRKEYTVYYDSRKMYPDPALPIQGPDGFRRVQHDGEMWNIDGRTLTGWEKSGIIPVEATSYQEAREKAHRLWLKRGEIK